MNCLLSEAILKTVSDVAGELPYLLKVLAAEMSAAHSNATDFAMRRARVRLAVLAPRLAGAVDGGLCEGRPGRVLAHGGGRQRLRDARRAADLPPVR